MADTTEIRQRIQSLLQMQLDNPRLLQQLEEIASVDIDDGYGNMRSQASLAADVWAEQLYKRDHIFFERFLTKYLPSASESIIRELLPRLEIDNNEIVFSTLYRVIANESDWNDELLAIVQTDRTVESIAKAVARRDLPDKNFVLTEETATALYRRSPTDFATFVRDHVRPGLVADGMRSRVYHDLRQLLLTLNDDTMYWRLFRLFGEPLEWKAEIATILQQNVPATKIVERLQRCQLEITPMFESEDLLPVVERYGQVVLPYIELNLNWIGYRTSLALLPLLEQMGAYSLFRRIFFTFGDASEWQAQLQRLIDPTLADAALATALQRWTPLPPQWSSRTWWLPTDIALELYQRSPHRFGPFIQLTLNEPSPELFDAAELLHDEDFLDFLSYRVLESISTKITYLNKRLQKTGVYTVGSVVSDLLSTYCRRLQRRFERLYAIAPSEYINHTANILSRGVGLVWYLADALANNPLAYIRQQHLDDWRQSPQAIRELLETPNLAVQRFGLTILAEGGDAAAQRVLENVLLLQAILLGREERPFKKLALKCLEKAAYALPEVADTVLPTLHEMMSFHGNTALEDSIMVSYVRARHVKRQLVATQS